MDDDEIGPDDAISPTPTTGDEKEAPQEVIKAQSHESIPPISSYQIKPSLEEKFKELPVKEILRSVQSHILGGKNYDPDMVKKWTISIANEVNERVRDLQMRRYKHVVQVLLGERKGQGVKSGVRCLWDSDVDGYTSELFMSDTIFCVTTVFAVYLY